MAEVTPELKSQIESYLKKRERGELSLLSFFYKEVFGRELKTSCGSCVSDAVIFLKQLTNKKQMNNYKWTGGDGKCTLRFNGEIILVNKHSCTDRIAEVVSGISKYAHLVEYVGEVAEKKLLAEVEKLVPFEDTTSTSAEVQTEEEVVKKKRGRPKLK